jgi:purine nucleosidase
VKRVILDMDPGVDDALAILLAVRSPELEVTGIGTVSGNVALEACTRNALKALALAGRPDIPVRAGASRPLVRDPVRAEMVHGRDGLGDAGVPDPAGSPDPEATYLVRELADHPGLLSVIATGPLTNLALAERKSPGILRNTREVILMGGAIREQGNIAPTGEFNFVADPHAAREVLRAGADLLMVPLDVTHRCRLTESTFRDRIAPAGTPISGFLARATACCRAYMNRVEGLDGFHLHDPLAVAMGIDPSLCDVEVARVDVETEGTLTAGQVVVDRRRFLDDGLLSGVPVKVCAGVDHRRFRELFLSRLLG